MESFVTIAAVVTAVSCLAAVHTYLAIAVAETAEALGEPAER
jgi:hypothetical protein